MRKKCIIDRQIWYTLSLLTFVEQIQRICLCVCVYIYMYIYAKYRKKYNGESLQKVYT